MVLMRILPGAGACSGSSCANSGAKERAPAEKRSARVLHSFLTIDRGPDGERTGTKFTKAARK